MASYFFDTNALIKAYIYEPGGSDWVLGVISAKQPEHQLFISEIARVEIPSALYKIERARGYAQEITNLAVNRFERCKTLMGGGDFGRHLNAIRTG